MQKDVDLHRYLYPELPNIMSGIGDFDSLKESYPEQQQALTVALVDVRAEAARAINAWPEPHHSAHESLAILEEEVEELKVHVRTNQKRRDLTAMRKEAVQVAAMALRFVMMLDAGRGRV
jgi:hypothetical protein